jgi:hypothetical protein
MADYGWPYAGHNPLFRHGNGTFRVAARQPGTVANVADMSKGIPALPITSDTSALRV